MSTPVEARYCDGETLRSRDVTIEVTSAGTWRVTGENLDLQVAPAELQISEVLGRVPRFARWADGRMLEIPAEGFEILQPEAPAPTSRLAQLIHQLETRAAVAAVATVLLVAGVASGLWLGLPVAARRAALMVPPELEQQVGNTSYRALAGQVGGQSNVKYAQRERFERLLQRLVAVRPVTEKPRIRFLRMGVANAFALPGGTIVVTDELVDLGLSDDEIAAVLAHELGHVQKRHGLQSILRGSSALIVVATVTGDLSTLTTFAGTLPFMLLQSGYSREFEREADAYAADNLRAAKIDPGALADALEALEKGRPSGGQDFSYLSTHPSTDERIRSIRGERGGK